MQAVSEPTAPLAPDEPLPNQHLVLLPDLGLGVAPLVLSVWLVEPGHTVTAGDRLVEIAAPQITIDLPAPVGGILLEQRFGEGDEVSPGDIVAVMQVVPDPELV